MTREEKIQACMDIFTSTSTEDHKALWEAYDALDPVKRSIASINIAFLFKLSHARMEENDDKVQS